MKKIIIIILIFILIIFSVIKFIDLINEKTCYSEYFCRVPVTGKMNIAWMDSPQNYEEALEKADIAFICKVNRIKDTIYRNPVRINLFTISYDPYTIYEVEVLKNIKGNTEINSIMEVMQLGGINKNKKTATLVEDIEMLEENCYYKLYPIEIELDEIEYLDITNPFRVEKVNYK